MNILGISCYYHDAAAALLKNSRLIAASQEERFTGKKHDTAFPCQSIDFCLKKARINKDELDYVIFYEKPFIKFKRIFFSHLATYPKAVSAFKDAMAEWLAKKLWLKTEIANYLKIENSKILFCDHHLAHAASAFFCSPFQRAALLTTDGVGEWSTATLGSGEKNKIKINYEMRFPHSLGLLYSTFTAYLGFRVNNGEYKVMGLASYGRPKYKNQIKKIVNIHSDGSLTLNPDYFTYSFSSTKMFSSKFEVLFGPQPPLYQNKKLNQVAADIAASLQEITEEILLKMCFFLYQKTKMKNLCYAGGVALNSRANYKLIKETPFENIFIQPAAGDAGGALGAALYLDKIINKKSTRFVMKHPYWGKEYDNRKIENSLKKENITYKKLKNESELIRQALDYLLQGKIIGWFQGRAEWGPRALGSRSILADPRNKKMKDIINSKIKFREPFRPFAPVVIEEKADRYFELKKINYLSPFMLCITSVKSKAAKKIPAVTHVDNTARPQIIKKKNNPLYYSLIKSFGQKTGIPVLLNTSFNLKGEPIVNSPKDALKTFFKSGIDALFIGSYLVTKKAKKIKNY